MSQSQTQPSPEPPPPAPSKPRVWLITAALSPLGYAVAGDALRAGDSVAAGCTRADIELERRLADADADADRHPDRNRLGALKALGGERVVVVELDTRNMALCQSSVAEAVYAFGRLDVLLNCSPSTYVGALEELSPAAILSQFEAAYFGPVNMMRATLPQLRRQRDGHMLNVTGLTGALGMPGLAARAAADHATEGLSDALAFEVAPFGVRVTVVQPGIEAGILSGSVALAPAHDAYTDATHPYAQFRSVVASTLPAPPPPSSSSSPKGVCEPTATRVPADDPTVLAETVAIILAIAGLDNPPGRIVVGNDAVDQIKERLKTVSEELEEFLDASLAADIAADETQAKDPGRASAGDEDIIG